MEITEKERLMLTKKKELICGLTLKVLDMAHDPECSLEIKKTVTTILSELNTIASYSNSKNHGLDRFEDGANIIFKHFDLKEYVLAECMCEVFCNAVNSVRFDFTKKGLKIRFPKINLNLGFITNK
ncbi:MAG: hypothetical protein ABSB28_05505 [Candidatus Bathyarchaeia archaeon]